MQSPTPSSSFSDWSALSKLLDLTSDCMLVVDGQMQIMAANQACSTGLGMERHALLGLSLPAVDEARPGVPSSATLRLIAPWLRQALAGAAGSLSAPGGITIEHRPITFGLAQATACKLSLPRPDDADSALVHPNRFRLLADLAAGFAHDLGNALAPTPVLVELIKSQLGQDSLLCDSLAVLAEKSATLLQHFVTLTGTLGEEPQPISARWLLETAVAALAGAHGRRINLQLAATRDLGFVHGAPIRLQIAVLQLLTAVVKTTPSSPVCRLSAYNLSLLPERAAQLGISAGDYVECQIFRELTPDERSRLQARAAGDTGPAADAAGQFIAAAQAVIRGAGGYIDATAAGGDGAVLSLGLPRLETAPPTEPASPPLPATAGQARGSVIILSTGTMTAQLVERLLTGWKLSVSLACDSARALPAIDRSVDLAAVIIDRGVSRRGLTRLLGRHQVQPFRLIVLNANPGMRKLARTLRPDQIRLVDKPIRPHQLFDALFL